MEKQVNRYFDLSEKSELSSVEQLQFQMCRTVAERCNIHNRDELQRVEKMRRDTSEKVASLTEQMNNCKKLYTVYANIADTYKKISEGTIFQISLPRKGVRTSVFVMQKTNQRSLQKTQQIGFK